MLEICLLRRTCDKGLIYKNFIKLAIHKLAWLWGHLLSKSVVMFSSAVLNVINYSGSIEIYSQAT